MGDVVTIGPPSCAPWRSGDDECQESSDACSALALVIPWFLSTTGVCRTLTTSQEPGVFTQEHPTRAAPGMRGVGI